MQDDQTRQDATSRDRSPDELYSLSLDEVVDIFLPVRFFWVRRARWLKLHAKRSQRHDAPKTPMENELHCVQGA